MVRERGAGSRCGGGSKVADPCQLEHRPCTGKAILDRLIEEEIPEVAETAETAESFGLTEEQAERWQPIVRQRAEAYVSKRANALKGADAEAFYDAGIDAVARAIAAYKGDPKGLDAYIGRAVSNSFNTMASRLGKNQTASLDESIEEDGSQTRGDMRVDAAVVAAW